jgi:hypothetical protein
MLKHGYHEGHHLRPRAGRQPALRVHAGLLRHRRGGALRTLHGRSVRRWWCTKYDGSLKAEHGTGRNMAPFVEMEWGKQAYRPDEARSSAVRPAEPAQPGRHHQRRPPGAPEEPQAHAGGRALRWWTAASNAVSASPSARPTAHAVAAPAHRGWREMSRRKAASEAPADVEADFALLRAWTPAPAAACAPPPARWASMWAP